MRGHRRNDFEDSARMWADPEVVRYITGQPSTESESWSRLLRYVGHWSLIGFGYWLVEERETGHFLGEVGFANYRRGLSTELDALPEVGWVFTTSAHGRGLATETVKAAVAWGDANLKSEKTICLFDPVHSASIKVALKAGYEELRTIHQPEQPTLVMQRYRGE